MSYMSQMVICENCYTEVEVLFTKGNDGQPDPNQSNCCPPEPASWEPEECPECSHVLLVEEAEQMIRGFEEAAEEDHLEAQAEMRREEDERSI